MCRRPRKHLLVRLAIVTAAKGLDDQDEHQQPGGDKRRQGQAQHCVGRGADEHGQRGDCDPVVEKNELGVPRALPAQWDQMMSKQDSAGASHRAVLEDEPAVPLLELGLANAPVPLGLEERQEERRRDGEQVDEQQEFSESLENRNIVSIMNAMPLEKILIF